MASNFDNMFFNENAPAFHDIVKGQRVLAKVVEAFDGDTVKCVFPLPIFGEDHFHTQFKFTCRLLGINTPEIRTKDADEKQRGFAARDRLREIILGKVVTLECSELDKYGRLLVTIFTTADDPPINVNQYMIDNGFAVPYMV